MKKFIKKYRFPLIGMLVGAIAGFCYWKFVGCSTGTCPITSKPQNSTLYGALVGFLLMGIFSDRKKQTENR